MLTDIPPRHELHLAQFLLSDLQGALDLPRNDSLRRQARCIELALESESTSAVKRACDDLLGNASNFYGVSRPQVRVLAARPLRSREGRWTTELFGDYTPDSMAIRIWMRTARRRKVTSFGTFLSTLCHEFCHHLDYKRFGFEDSPHTRGFYARTAVLYHHLRGTPPKRLFWRPAPGARWRIDWQRTNRPNN